MFSNTNSFLPSQFVLTVTNIQGMKASFPETIIQAHPHPFEACVNLTQCISFNNILAKLYS